MKQRITFLQALRAINQDDPRRALKVVQEYFAQEPKRPRK